MTRVLVFTLLGFALMVVLGPFQVLLGMDMVLLDVPLIIVVYMAMADRVTAYGRLISRSGISSSRIDWSGGLTAVILGYMTDVLGGGIKGIHCLTLAVVFLACRRAARHVYLAGTMSTIVVTFTASAAASLLTIGILWLTDQRPGPGLLSVAGIQALLNALVSPALIKILRTIDGRLLRESVGGRIRG